MSKFIINMLNAHTGEVIDTEEETFDNERDAREYAKECGSAFATEGEVLKELGREYTPKEDVEFVVEEIDDED